MSTVPASRITSQTATSDVDDACTCDCSTTFEVRHLARRIYRPHRKVATVAACSPKTFTCKQTGKQVGATRPFAKRAGFESAGAEAVSGADTDYRQAPLGLSRML